MLFKPLESVLCLLGNECKAIPQIIRSSIRSKFSKVKKFMAGLSDRDYDNFEKKAFSNGPLIEKSILKS